MFPEIPEDLSSLSDDELEELETNCVGAFNDATAEGSAHSDEDVASLASLTEGIERIRSEAGTRAEAAAARQEQLASLAERVNASQAGEEDEEDGGGESATEGDEPAEPDQPAEVDVPQPTEQPAEEQQPEAVPASGKARAVTASVAQLKRNSPVKTRPRPVDPVTQFPSVTAAADIAGKSSGSKLKSVREISEMFAERRRTLGEGNGERAGVVQFHRELPTERDLEGISSPEEFENFLNKFDRTANGIQAAGGLCAPLEGYYDQYTLAQAMRPVRDSLPSFNATRGGITFNPPPKLSDITTGSGTGIHRITAAEDLAGSPTKGTFSLACPSTTSAQIYAIYMQLKFGNMPARTFPERYDAITKTALAQQARLAEQYLLDAIAAASTPVTTVGLVGAGRELFVRLGQAAAGYRSRNRIDPNFPLRVMLPAWSLDLVQADFARTFTDENGFISMSREDAARLFGTRNLNPTFYVDSKTGGGQVFGGANSGRSTSADGVTTSGSATVTSASGAFTSADIGKTITGSIAGIPAGATITAVASGTSITISANATATTASNIFRIGANVLAEFPTTVYAYLFSEGSFLHLDGGTLDLGLVRDSTLNSTNEFTTFAEDFENVAFIGQESLEIQFTLHPDGSYAAAKSITTPILT